MLFFQPPNDFSRAGISVDSFASPTTKSAALAGWKYAACHAARSLRVIFFTVSGVPSAGKPQG